jgi:hypothetical protein
MTEQSIDHQIAPEMLLVEQDYVQVGNSYCKTIYLMHYPAQVEDGWLQLFCLKHERYTDISMFINPLDTSEMLTKLKNRIAQLEARLAHDEKKKVVSNLQVERSYNDLLELYNLIAQSLTKPFQVSVVITVWGSSVDSLNTRVEDIERNVTAAKTRRADLKHLDGLLTQLPVLDNKLCAAYSVKNIHSQGLATMFPFIYNDCDDDEQADRIVLSDPKNPGDLTTAKKLPNFPEV